MGKILDKTLVVSYCKNKLEGTHRAIDLYQGRAFNLIRKENLREKIDVWILSTKYSLIHADKFIRSYDQIMDRKRSIELCESKLPDNFSKKDTNTSIYIYGGKKYRDVLNAWFNDLTIEELIGQNRGCGDHYSALKNFVEEMKK